jgi:serine protease AprX
MNRRGPAVRIFLGALIIVGSGLPGRAQLPPPSAPLPPPSAPLPPPSAPLPPPPGLDKLDPLLQAAATTPTGRSLVIVRAHDAQTLDEVAALVAAAGGVLGRQLSIIEAQVADVPNAALLTLANNAIVRRIAADRPTGGTMERTGATVGAVTARQTFGYDGSGIGVAVIDSGVTPWHNDLNDQTGAQRVDDFVDFVNGHTTPYDDYGHGTHVAGIIAGNGFNSGGARSGIAPGARISAVKVLNDSGRGRISDLIAAFEYVIAHKDTHSIRIVNLSVAAGVYESYDTDFLTLAAKRAVDAGLIVVAAAGNAGRRSGRTQYASITAPGNAPWVLTVGASSHAGTIDRADDTVAAFSSRGPTAVDYAAKPDVVAPGVGIESLSDPTSRYYTEKATSLLTGTVATGYLPYLSLSGTSQATPVVSGTIALMLQAHPGLTANAVKAILQYTAEARGSDELTEGAGFLNAQGAVELARFFAGVGPWPDSDETWSRHVIWGNQRVAGGILLPTGTAWLPDVPWGAATRDGEAISWGATQADPNTGEWITWAMGAENEYQSSENVVWGSACGGTDCPADTTWTTSEPDTIVWGTNDDDTIVWGTNDDDTIVWGTSCDDPSCTP